MKGRPENFPLINEKIRAEKLQVVTHEGINLGVISKRDALQYARDADLDLVTISEEGQEGVPVAKIMDFGKALYKKKKKQHEAKKSQKIVQVKEIKLRPKIGEHDYVTKMKQAIQFLHEGKRVKITLFFRGREHITREERGRELFDCVDETLRENNLLNNVVKEGESKTGHLWSQIYYLKNLK